ncbi:hypothetical protein GGR54DRAFT_25847 [Hypoxylon sp. NC1633]|nr:hypothetical protein GGR54DRAFT_25847 [Hypoxylon sp. NC1633]
MVWKSANIWTQRSLIFYLQTSLTTLWNVWGSEERRYRIPSPNSIRHRLPDLRGESINIAAILLTHNDTATMHLWYVYVWVREPPRSRSTEVQANIHEIHELPRYRGNGQVSEIVQYQEQTACEAMSSNPSKSCSYPFPLPTSWPAPPRSAPEEEWTCLHTHI